MRDHSQHIQLTRDDAVSIMLNKLEESGYRARSARLREHVRLSESLGRVLAQNVLAKTDIPNVLTCCLDSVALHWDDFADLSEGELPDTSTWVRGVDWEFANTGIAMPKGFDTPHHLEK